MERKGEKMEDNKELKENTELDDDQVENVSGGFISREEPKQRCVRCGKEVPVSTLNSGVCRDCCNKLAREGRPVIA